MRLWNAFKYSVFEASKLVPAKTLLLKHYCRRQGIYTLKLHRNYRNQFDAITGAPATKWGHKKGFHHLKPSRSSNFSDKLDRGQKINANFFCTKFFENASGHGRPRRKSWTSAPKSAFFCGAGDGEKLFDPGSSGRKGQECPREIQTKKFMFMLFFLPWLEANPSLELAMHHRKTSPKLSDQFWSVVCRLKGFSWNPQQKVHTNFGKLLDLAHQNRTIAIASDFRGDGAKSPEIQQKEEGWGSEITARNRRSLATFDRTLKSQCSTAFSCVGNRCDFWGPQWASQSQKSLRFRCAKLLEDKFLAMLFLDWHKLCELETFQASTTIWL